MVVCHEHCREARRRTRRRHFQAPKTQPRTWARRGGKGELTKGIDSAKERARRSVCDGEPSRLGEIQDATSRARICGVGGGNKARSVAGIFIGFGLHARQGNRGFLGVGFGVHGFGWVQLAHGERKTTGAARWGPSVCRWEEGKSEHACCPAWACNRGGERKGQGGLGRALGRCQRSARRAGPSATGEKGGWAGLKSRELSPLFLFIPKAI
jgi:hypothetical protein